MHHLSFFTWNPNPVIFNIGFFPVRYYSLFFALGIGLSYKLMQKRYVNSFLTQRQLDSLSVYLVIGILLGARLGHCLFYESSYFLAHPSEIFLPVHISDDGQMQFTGYQGLASHGGAIGFISALLYYCHKNRLSFLSLADRLVIVAPLASASIRIGNFFNAEIIGKPSTLPWAIVFESFDKQPRHPSQLYEALSYLVIFLLLLFRSRKSLPQKRKGIMLGLFLVLTFSTRFLLEFLKAPQESFENNLWINMGQILSIPFILLGLYLLFFPKYNTAQIH